MSEQEHILITIDIATIDWTEGEHAGFSFKLKPGTNIRVDWGDGRSSQLIWTGSKDNVLLDHYYKCNKSVRNDYQVVVSSASQDAIIGFASHTIDMEIVGLDISRCQSLEKLYFNNLPSIDLTQNAGLKEVDLPFYEGESIDLSGNPLLSVFKLMYSHTLKKLSFTHNPLLKEVDCSQCHKLTKVAIANDSAIESFKCAMSPISEKCLEWIERTINLNREKEDAAPIHLERADELWFRQFKILAGKVQEGLRSIDAETKENLNVDQMIEAFSIVEKATSNDDCTPEEEKLIADGVKAFMENYDTLGVDNWPSAMSIKVFLVTLFDKEYMDQNGN